MTGRDLIYFALERFQTIERAETNFERVLRGMREAKEAQERRRNGDPCGPDSETPWDGSDDDWS